MKKSIFGKSLCLLLLVCLGISVFVTDGKLFADEEIKYLLKVNVAQNTLMVYGRNEDGSYGSLIKTMQCASSQTVRTLPTGLTVHKKEEWKSLPDGSFLRYACVLSDGTSVASVPYTEQAPDKMSTIKYNALGTAIADVNVWLCCADAKWLYENCAPGTSVEFVAEEDGTGLNVRSIKIPSGSQNAGWDPTDDTETNPWRSCKASIDGARDIRMVAGQKADLLEGVKAYDTCGNDITSTMLIMGNYDFNKVGEYEITYYVKDIMGSAASRTVKITVVKDNRLTLQNEETKTEKNSKSRGQKIEVMILLVLISSGATYFILRTVNKN